VFAISTSNEWIRQRFESAADAAVSDDQRRHERCEHGGERDGRESASTMLWLAKILRERGRVQIPEVGASGAALDS
jgi:hypothetical protein